METFLKMNKQNKIKELTWKYFWEQKIKEITKVELVILGIGLFFGLLPYWLGHIGECTAIVNSVKIPCSTFLDYADNGWKYVIYGIAIIGAISAIILGIALWISNNWEKAEKRAKRKIK